MLGRKIIGMDFGTSKIKMYKTGSGIILEEKNVIAVENRSKVLAIGDNAYEMLGKSPDRIQVSMPIQNGVIADLENMKLLLNAFLDKVSGKGKIRSSDYLVAIPTNITEVEKRAFYELVQHSNGKAKKVSIVHRPLVAALGMDVDITKSKGVMVVDMGADTTEIAVMSLGGIVLSKIIPIGGNKMDESIKTVMKKEGLFIGDKTAELIKNELSSAIDPTDKKMNIFGRNVMNGLPTESTIDADTVYHAIREHLLGIVSAIRVILERTPPEIASDIIDAGIYVTGGLAQIKGLDTLIQTETNLQVNIAEKSENSVIKGLGAMAENRNLMGLAVLVK